MSKRWLSPVVIAAMAAFAAIVYSRLPERVPTHFDASGSPDGWMARWPGAFLFAGIGLVVWLLLLGLRRIDPRRAHYQRFEGTYWIVLNIVVLLLAAFEAVSLGLGLGWPIDAGRVTYALLGVVFLLLGNYLPRLRSNWWMGIRTPWTLESERVWRETHRLGGKTFVAGGIALLLVALFLPEAARVWIQVPVLVVSVGTPLVYSYFAYRRERAEAPPAEGSRGQEERA